MGLFDDDDDDLLEEIERTTVAKDIALGQEAYNAGDRITAFYHYFRAWKHIDFEANFDFVINFDWN